MRSFYRNEKIINELKNLNLYEQAKKCGYVSYVKGVPYVSSSILLGCGGYSSKDAELDPRILGKLRLVK